MKLDVSLPVRARPIDWVIVFALAVAMVALHLLVSTQPRFSDADDAMHMVTAQSLADGQGWYDTTSYRENTPFGAPIHFSRLVDAPLALLITAFRPFVGAGASDLAALVWPLLLIPALFALCFALCRRLIPDADAVFVSLSLALSVVMYVEFSPGRVDHHNLQILATGALALATMVGRDNIRWAVAAGLLATLSLGIGAETAHLVAFATAVFGAYWAFGAAPARHVVAFALSLGLSSLALFLATIPPAAWLASACDAFSMSYLVAFVTAAAALIVATMFDRRVTGRIGRLALVGGSGVVALGVTLLASPACLHGAYTAVDPNLMKAFLLTVLDAQPASYLIAHQPLTALAFIVIPMLELLLGLYILAITKGPRRLDWAVLLGFFAVGMAVTLLQTRGIRVTAIYGVPVAAWLIHAAQKHHAAVRTVPALLLFSVSWLPFAGLVQVLVAATVLDAVAAPSPGDADRKSVV